jgi:Flp pilus assembly protein TadG
MKNQSGATMVEFALVLILFLTVLLGIVDFARMLWTWNAATEATRWGARISVVCDKGATAVLASMKSFLPQLEAENVQIDWYTWDDATSTYTASASCTATGATPSTNCAGVNVKIQDLNYQWMGPVAYGFQASFGMPGFSTFLPREIMGQDPDSDAVCSAP